MRLTFPALTLGKFFGSLTFLLMVFAGGSNLRAADGLQAYLNHLLLGRQGAAIVSDPRTGQILAIWNSQIALEQAYPPGSTAKIVVSAAALEEDAISSSERILCRRVPRLLGPAYRCSHPQATEPFDLAGALANSCNYFFAEVGTRISSAALAHWYGAFGFGLAEEDASPGEVHIPDQPKGRALAALGERGVTASPAQILLAYSAVAMQGKMFQLIMPGQRKAPSLDRVVALRPSTLEALTRGLRDCVKIGTCRAAAVPGVAVAGKTGTAPALDGSRTTHAWFVGYAPVDAPEVALVVFLKRGTGGANAAPLAAQILRRYFAAKLHQP